MIHDYKLASATYDLVRKDFNNDKAWRDFAQASVCPDIAASVAVRLSDT